MVNSACWAELVMPLLGWNLGNHIAHAAIRPSLAFQFLVNYCCEHCFLLVFYQDVRKHSHEYPSYHGVSPESKAYNFSSSRQLAFSPADNGNPLPSWRCTGG
jgi:hypothetical protein